MDPGERPPYLLLIGEVGLQRQFTDGVLALVDAHNRRTLALEPFGDGFGDDARRTGNDAHLAREPV